MQPEGHDAAYLWDMLQAARSIQEFTRNTSFDEYSSNEMRRLAVERALQILGDAARRVSDSFRRAHPEIPWKGIVGQRNVIVHDYADLVPLRIWDLAREEIPILVQQLERLVPVSPG
jgi:uncharacterized protein with HEPN domain